jgi:histone H3/H4
MVRTNQKHQSGTQSEAGRAWAPRTWEGMQSSTPHKKAAPETATKKKIRSTKVSRVPAVKSATKKGTEPYVRRKENFGIPRASIRNLAYKSGIERLSGDSYRDICDTVITVTRRMAYLARTLAEFERRTTVSARDITRALDLMGIKIY